MVLVAFPDLHTLGMLILVCPCAVRSALVPLSNCYCVAADTHLYDLSDFYGKQFDYEQGTTTYVLRLCKDFQERSQSGYVSFGKYQLGPVLSSTPATANFIQEYRQGDLNGCEDYGTQFNGRLTKVAVICGSCPGKGQCKDPTGCICSVDLEATTKSCLASVVLAIACPEPGPQVVEGFAVGFSPRGREVVDNGFTQWGYENTEHSDYSFETLQSKIFLYFSAPTLIAKNVGKPTYSAYPSKGLAVKLSGTAALGTAPTVMSPSVLEVDWFCETQNSYVLTISVPVLGYDPVEFSLLKQCARKQTKEQSGSSGWATFGILSCIFIVITTVACCGGILYRTRVERKRGLEALPGIGLLAGCLDMFSTYGGDGYGRADETTTIIEEHHPLRGGASSSTRAGPVDGKYGAV
ncbi:hypothetical protein R1flu_020938 [Riccia fluitans]|uniref:MRH domain-containing protein n=1 Tax=Riccia fluitans TaxID=41844 RepID=A0ABD1ZN97_9MARC